MSKKALKSLQADVRKSRSQSKISFNKSSFNLGNLLVITDQLKKQTRDILIEEYKNNKFKKEIQKQNPMIHGLDNKKKYVILTEQHAHEIIKENLLIYLNQPNQSFGIKQKPAFSKFSNKQSKNTNFPPKPSYYQKIKQKFRLTQKSSNKANEQEILGDKLANDEYIRDLIQSKSLKIDQQIFTKSIVMIIEKQIENENDVEGISTKSIVVFEKPYPFKQFDRQELTSMIGRTNYQQKLLAALKIYEYSITNQNFNNPLFQTCHYCMKVKSSLEFPQDSLFCPKKLQLGESKYISSNYVYSPFSYMKKILQKDHFNSEDQPFTHPYLQYHTQSFSDNKLACNRRWCGFCMINGRKNMSSEKCQFCEFTCRCSRCRKFEKLIKLMAYYFNYGGEYHQIRPKFIFSQVFDSQHFNYESKKNKSSFFNRYLFPYMQQLRKTHQINKKYFQSTKQWTKLPFSAIISGSKPETKRQFEMIQENWQMQRIQVKKNQNPFEMNKKKKNKRKTHGAIKAHNIEAKINNLTQETKKKFIQTANEQQRILTNELVRSGVIKSSNPLENPALKMKKEKEIMLQQTELQKKEKKFFGTVPIVEWKQQAKDMIGKGMDDSRKKKENKR